MTNETVAAFIAALPEKRQAACAEALKLVTAAEVYNADYVDAKFTLARSVDEAWDALKVPYDTYRVIGSVMCLHDIISMSKKVAKAGASIPAADRVRVEALCVAFLPVALLMKSLKNNTIKARKPASAEVLAERAAKEASKNRMERATCGCCFSNQAVLPNGLIHDHGYKLPREWMKTGSCYGRQFRPLEVSDEGPKFMVTMLEAAEKNAVAAAEAAPKATKLFRNKWDAKCTEQVGPEHPAFARLLVSHVAEAESRLRSIRTDLAEFRKVVAEWKAA